MDYKIIFPLKMNEFTRDQIIELTCLNWYDGPLDGLVLINDEICYYSILEVDTNEYCQLRDIKELDISKRFIFGLFLLKNNNKLLVSVIKHLCLINNHYNSGYLTPNDLVKTEVYFENKPELGPNLFTNDDLIGWFEW